MKVGFHLTIPGPSALSTVAGRAGIHPHVACACVVPFGISIEGEVGVYDSDDLKVLGLNMLVLTQ